MPARRCDLGTLACLRRLGVLLRVVVVVVAAAVRDGAPWSSLEIREL